MPVKMIIYALVSLQFGDTSLHWASRSGHASIVKKLLQEGDDINARGQVSSTEWTLVHEILTASAYVNNIQQDNNFIDIFQKSTYDLYVT